MPQALIIGAGDGLSASLARLLAHCLRLPERAGVALALVAAGLGAGLGAWAGTLSSSG